MAVEGRRGRDVDVSGLIQVGALGGTSSRANIAANRHEEGGRTEEVDWT